MSSIHFCSKPRATGSAKTNFASTPTAVPDELTCPLIFSEFGKDLSQASRNLLTREEDFALEARHALRRNSKVITFSRGNS